MNTNTKAKPTTTAATSLTKPASRNDSHPPDEEVLKRVADCLSARDIPSFARIGVDVRRGIVTVRGDVASKGEQLLLLHLLRKIPGVELVHDGLSLKPARQAPVRRASRLKAASFAWPNLSDWMSDINFKRGVTAALLIGASTFWFWPTGPSRPVAVHRVKGKAIMEGKPMAGAHLVLHPGPDSKIPVGITPRGTVADDGTFELSTFSHKDGAPNGEFVVTVVWNKPVIVDGETQSGPSLVSAEYATPSSSPLRLSVTGDAKELAPVEIKTGLATTSRTHPPTAYDHE